MGKKPRGLKNVWESGLDAVSGLLGFPEDLKMILYVGLGVVGLVLVVVIGTACWGVGSGKIDVNQLAESGAKAATAMPKVMPI